MSMVKRLRPVLGDIATHAIKYPLHPSAGLSTSGDLGIPRIGLAEPKLGRPRQQFLPLAHRKRRHLLGDLLYAGCYFSISHRS